jgi:predicted RNase H-like HicB family nuclease
MGRMEANYRAVIQQRESWWIGWIAEVPGVNSQGKTREELLDNLRSALGEALEMNRADALAAVQGAAYERGAGRSRRVKRRALLAP